MTLTKDQKTKRFINKLATTVPSPDYRPGPKDGPPSRQCQLSTIRDRCGYDRLSAEFLRNLTIKLEDLGIYSHPPMKVTLKPKTRITFSRQRTTDVKAAPREVALEAYLMHAPGELKGISPAAQLEHQVRIPGTNKKVDILATDGHEITIIELKKADGAPGVRQLVQYMNALRKTTRAKDHDVRGILLSGVADEDTKGAVKDARIAGHDLTWYVYKLDFSMKEEK